MAITESLKQHGIDLYEVNPEISLTPDLLIEYLMTVGKNIGLRQNSHVIDHSEPPGWTVFIGFDKAYMVGRFEPEQNHLVLQATSYRYMSRWNQLPELISKRLSKPIPVTKEATTS